LSLYALNTLHRATCSVRDYSREILAAAQAIERNTAAIPATNDTIAVGTDLVAASEAVAAKLDAMASVHAARARRG
jgi:hypothetical protein